VIHVAGNKMCCDGVVSVQNMLFKQSEIIHLTHKSHS